jgi:hypothetical protein
VNAWSWALRKRLIHWLAGGRHYTVNQPPLHTTPFGDYAWRNVGSTDDAALWELRSTHAPTTKESA